MLVDGGGASAGGDQDVCMKWVDYVALFYKLLFCGAHTANILWYKSGAVITAPQALPKFSLPLSWLSMSPSGSPPCALPFIYLIPFHSDSRDLTTIINMSMTL